MTSVEDAIKTLERNIEEKTGRRFPEWLGLCRASGHEKHGALVAWLKATHGLGHGYANHIAKQSLKPDEQPVDAQIDAQFAGAKAGLRPLYEAAIGKLLALGADVEIAPKKNNVSIRRRRQFALLQPSTATRLDLGLILPDHEPTARLERSGSFNAMFTHRVRLAAVSEFDAELGRWIAAAYQAAG